MIMKNLNIMANMSRSFHRFGLQLRKHSPEILLVAGVAGAVVSAVMACKATLKVNEVMDKSKTDIDKIHTAVEKGKTEGGKDYNVEDSKKDLAIVYAQTGLEFLKLYGPALTLGTASIGCILASNNIIRKRNVALAAAYASVDSSFKDYRKRVVERFGKELDRELKYNIKAQEVEEVVVDEDGNETKVKTVVNVVDPNTTSDYARFFDESCIGWDKNAEYNLTFLKHQQNYANDLLKTRGHLFLNEVYDMLGMQRTKAGQVVGWVYDEKGEIGDNFVDFGIYDIDNERKRAFVNGHERVILLDFNVDGNIWELMH